MPEKFVFEVGQTTSGSGNPVGCMNVQAETLFKPLPKTEALIRSIVIFKEHFRVFSNLYDPLKRAQRQKSETNTKLKCVWRSRARQPVFLYSHTHSRRHIHSCKLDDLIFAIVASSYKSGLATQCFLLPFVAFRDNYGNLNGSKKIRETLF
jgi:hypothetical protein